MLPRSISEARGPRALRHAENQPSSRPTRGALLLARRGRVCVKLIIAHPRSKGAARSAAPARIGRLSSQKQRKNTHTNEAS